MHWALLKMEEKNKFIEENIGLVHLCAKRFIGRGVEYEDLVQIGSVGLIKAVNKFDKSRGLKFSTYAVPVIIGEIKGFFRSDGIVKISRRIKELSIKINAVVGKYSVEHGTQPSVRKIAEILGETEESVTEAMSVCSVTLSLTNFGENNDNEYDIPTQSREEEITDKLSLRQIIGDLSEKDKVLIEMRYFKNKTQTEVAKVCGCSQVQISRREKNLLLFLRERLVIDN